jgi:hypothetical protein
VDWVVPTALLETAVFPNLERRRNDYNNFEALPFYGERFLF